MRDFALCEACRAEYDDPASRRFHAQPNACAACGPRLSFETAGFAGTAAGALEAAVAALRAGGIVAVKGIGGYHLACLASDEAAVRRLREQKQRDEKPFAVMVADVAAAERLVTLTPQACALLASPARPIVLCPRRDGAAVAGSVAPGSPWLGVLLAYAPIHHLLLRDLGLPLVMTSGNLSHEPIEYDDGQARMRLLPVADGLLGHDRPIRTRCDDSVVRPLARGAVLLRRARGLSPAPLTLAADLARPVLALGAESNLTFALGRGRHVFVSHHLGDMEHYAAYSALLEAEPRFEQLFEVAPALIAHDLHPDYRSSALARRWAEERDVPLVAVQHHHAHIASVMLEHELDGPVLGVAFDGTGLGSDGTIWGGEFLLATRHGFERVAHLRAVGMPGGDRAVLEPWRMAVAYLRDAGLDLGVLGDVGAGPLAAVSKLLEKGAFCPPTSSAGRLFDAVAALTGVRRDCHYDGQPAIELEWVALGATDDGSAYDFELARERPGAPWVLDTRPLVRGVAGDVARGVAPGVVSRRFHRTLAALVTNTLERLRAEHGVARVVLGGGVFGNGVLLDQLLVTLPARGFEPYRPERFPPGDGGLCLGQLAVAAAQAEKVAS
jgi:hydrogenase maturation protein HypF